MMFPSYLQQQAELLAVGLKTGDLAEEAQNLSSKYRQEKADNHRMLQTEREALSYALVRMPATFGAVSDALEKTLEMTDVSLKTLLDVGAGTGAASWAAYQQLNLDHLICLEREKVMLDLGQKFMQNSSESVLNTAEWRKCDLLKDHIPDMADLVCASYFLNELDEENRAFVIKKLWAATKKILLIVEPGTPKVFAGFLKLREQMLCEGAHILAPCSHALACPLLAGDWCHFSCRISRSKLHKQLKGASMGYEDEKYCFMAFSRYPIITPVGRILKKPIVNKVNVELEICQPQGEIEHKHIVSKDKDFYKRAKKLTWGDKIS